jgi:hypothetical protein
MDSLWRHKSIIIQYEHWSNYWKQDEGETARQGGKTNFQNSDDSFQEISWTFMCVDNLILIV